VQPRPGVWAAEVIAPPPLEGGEERLANHIVGGAVPQPPGDIPVDVRGVPVIQAGERLGLMPGLLAQRGIIRVLASAQSNWLRFVWGGCRARRTAQLPSITRLARPGSRPETTGSVPGGDQAVCLARPRCGGSRRRCWPAAVSTSSGSP